MKNRSGMVVIIGLLGVAIFLLVFKAGLSSRAPSAPGATGSTASPAATPLARAPVAAKTMASTPAAVAADSTPPAALTAPLAPVAAPVLPVASAPEFTNLPPETVMENVRTVFRSYQSMFRDNPVGTNPEITQALNGGNRKQAHFLNEEDGLRINARGELIDSWGTPFFFHQLSGTEMEIHSAGPDRVLWTSDDLVTK